MPHTHLILGLFVALLTGLVGCAGSEDNNQPQCRFTSECPPGNRCVDGNCVIEFGDGGQCPPGQTQIDGICQEGCRGDNDCPDGRCVDRQCFANQCMDGASEPCENGCGVRTCQQGVWRLCREPSTEVCGGGVDEDCDSRIDEGCSGCIEGAQRDCMTECGVGQESCLDNEWRFCTAPRVHPEICGNTVDDDCDGTIDEGCDNCADGDTRPCGNEFCPGTETCRDRTWQGCTANPPSHEICDMVDNDCDGAADEELARDCQNACGPGVELCKNGEWRDCNAPENCPCEAGIVADQQICGACGLRTRECQGGTWGEWSDCTEVDAQCQPGAEEMEACGNCGTHSRRCTGECRWGDWQPCNDVGECIPGSRDEQNLNSCEFSGRVCNDMCNWETDCSQVGPSGCEQPGEEQIEPCGNCGVRRRVCTDCCGWSEWSACESEGVCEPGTEDARQCEANCSVQIRQCTDACEWTDFGACSDGGQCGPGAFEERACGNCGVQSRQCSDGCIWAPWGACGNEGVCAAGETEGQACGIGQGECVPGVSERICSDECNWEAFGECVGAVEPRNEICGNGLDEDCDGNDPRRPDAHDSVAPNDTCDTCTDLNSAVNRDLSNFPVRGTIDHVGDRDYYCIYVDDGINAPFFGEHFRVTMEGIPPGRDYDIRLYRSVIDCRNRNSLASSINGGNRDEEIDWEEPNGDDDGRFVLEVYPGVVGSQHCDDEYLLEINGLN